ncbi:MAG: tyrosine-protein phosphatase [Bacteroidales bacterium]|jgi:protein-tyrosine phosphatase|nr:tyrosine-protein phosphatase [Bacteroidales bacterium]
MNTKNNLFTYFFVNICIVIVCLFVSCRNNPPHEQQRAGILEEAPNFRDLGGYASGNGKQTVWKKIFRSQSLAFLNDHDVEKIKELGIKTIIDFRDDDEVQKAPSRLPADVNIIRLPIGLGNNDSTQQVMQQVMSGQLDSLQCIRFMEDANRRFATEFAPQYKAFFAVLLQPESYPVVFHCTAGKDRTGFAAAILLSALGADWDTVMDDYLLTNRYLKPQTLMPQLPKEALPAIRQMWDVQPSYLNAARDEIIKRYGSVDNYLQKELNIGEVEKEQLGKCLLK